MKKFIKNIIGGVLALSMTVSFAGCEEFFDALGSEIGDAITSEIEDALGNSTGSTGSTGGSSTGSGNSSTGGSTGSTGSTGNSSTGGNSTGSGNSSTGGNSTGSTGGSTGSTGGGSTGSTGGNSTDDSSSGGIGDPELPDDGVITCDSLSIHFLELGNKYTGDCTYIKAGDVDILIDAGSRKNSAPTITSYVNQYCTDGTLEYVIATHADQDHIAAFVGSSGKGIFDVYEIETLIDFPRTNKNTQIYKDYVAKRDALAADGMNHYTALEWWKEEQGLTRTIELAEGITMSVLYQTYYENSASDENDYSVCVLFSQGKNHYLFTGDLEEKGEASLVASNSLPKVQLYKGGHHGSKTSSTSALLAKIQPEIVCVCCCAGSDEYSAAPLNTFPTQDFINRVAPYTNRIYVTTLATSDSTGYTSMNGNITVSSLGKEVTLTCSNNDVILKETEWFKANRTWPTNGV